MGRNKKINNIFRGLKSTVFPKEDVDTASIHLCDESQGFLEAFNNMELKKTTGATTGKKKEQIKNILGECLGVDAEEINDDDSLRDDLHMNSSDIADFLLKLEEKGLITEEIDFTNINTVDEMIERLSQDEF